MRAPVAVYVDDRVARTMATEKDLEMAERGIEQVKYIREDVVKRMVSDATGYQAPEYLIQIHDFGGLLWGLSNYGRIVTTDTSGGEWDEIRRPDFNDDGLSG